jgi:uncharacterized protein (DUF2132 family)
LIVCEIEQSIDVIEKKLDENFFLKNCHIRTGEKSALKQLHQTQRRTKKLEAQFIKRSKFSILCGQLIVRAQQEKVSLLFRKIPYPQT